MYRNSLLNKLPHLFFLGVYHIYIYFEFLIGEGVEWLVFYQLCHLSLVIPVLSLAILGLSLAIPGLSLLVPSQFQYISNSSCLMFYQQYINRDNNLNHPGQ